MIKASQLLTQAFLALKLQIENLCVLFKSDKLPVNDAKSAGDPTVWTVWVYGGISGIWNRENGVVICETELQLNVQQVCVWNNIQPRRSQRATYEEM